MKAKITVCDHSGDSNLAEFDTDIDKSVEVAQEALTKFLNGCVLEYGEEPPVWAKRIGEPNFGAFEPNEMNTYEEVLVHAPIVSG